MQNLSEIFIGLLLIGGAPVVMMYVIGPFLVRSKQTVAGRLDLLPTEFDRLPQLAASGVWRTVNELVTKGFEVIGNFTSTTTAEQVRVVQLLLVHEAERCWVSAYYVGPDRPNAMVKATWTTAFHTRYADGASIVTASTRSSSVYPSRGNLEAINPYWITDPTTLFRIHQARVAAEVGRANDLRVVPPRDDAATFLQGQHTEEMQRVTAAGYYWLDPRTGRYRMTLTGAYIMTWRLL